MFVRPVRIFLRPTQRECQRIEKGGKFRASVVGVEQKNKDDLRMPSPRSFRYASL